MRTEAALRWSARAGSIVVALAFAAFAFGEQERAWPTLEEAGGLMLFPIGVLVGFAVAWRREALGGLISVGSLALFALWMRFRGRWPIGPYFLLLTTPAFLFLASAWLRQRPARIPDRSP